jgi:serine/threonine-protein kinase
MFEKPAPMFGQDTERSLGSLEQITLRALEKKPENRYPSMAALVADLDQVVGGGRPRPVAGQRPSTELADALEPRSKSEMNLDRQLHGQQHPAGQAHGESQPELPTRKRWPIAAAVVAAVLAAALLTFVARRDAGNAQPAAQDGRPPPAVPALAATTGAPTSPLAPQPGSGAAAAPASDTPRGLDPDSVAIAITSEPSGAEIVLDGAIIGRTPGYLPSTDSEGKTVELRLDGYQTERVKLGAALAQRLPIALKKRVAPVPKRPASAPAVVTKRKRMSEVVDPWAQ